MIVKSVLQATGCKECTPSNWLKDSWNRPKRCHLIRVNKQKLPCRLAQFAQFQSTACGIANMVTAKIIECICSSICWTHFFLKAAQHQKKCIDMSHRYKPVILQIKQNQGLIR